MRIWLPSYSTSTTEPRVSRVAEPRLRTSEKHTACATPAIAPMSTIWFNVLPELTPVTVSPSSSTMAQSTWPSFCAFSTLPISLKVQQQQHVMCRGCPALTPLHAKLVGDADAPDPLDAEPAPTLNSVPAQATCWLVSATILPSVVCARHPIVPMPRKLSPSNVAVRSCDPP